MLTRWSDFDRTFAVMNELQRRMNTLFEELDGGRWGSWSTRSAGTWPGGWLPMNLYDNGKELVVRALVPGLTEQELTITGNQDVITISGERQADAPEGYSVHRQERGAVSFSRSFTCPCKVDLEKATATVKNGVLTVTVAKAKEAQPRQIQVKA